MRRPLFKTYNLILLSAVLSFGFGFALNDDCLLATAPVSAQTWSIYSGAFPYQNLLIAYQNLYAYCCSKDLFADKDNINCTSAPTVNLESPYMIEHLIDVGLRSLDVSSLYSGQIVDSGAKVWYDVLHPTGDKVALTPLMIEAQYKKNWSLTHLPLLQDEVGSIENYLPLYSGFSLRDKYYNLCFLSKTLYEKILQPNEKNWPFYIGKQSNSSNLYNDCMSLARKKVSGELVTTQSLMLELSSSTLKNSIDSYVMTNFIKDNFLVVLGKLQEVVGLFQKVIRQAPLSKRCAQ